jgi:hypothetical protein
MHAAFPNASPNHRICHISLAPLPFLEKMQSGLKWGGADRRHGDRPIRRDSLLAAGGERSQK